MLEVDETNRLSYTWASAEDSISIKLDLVKKQKLARELNMHGRTWESARKSGRRTAKMITSSSLMPAF